MLSIQGELMGKILSTATEFEAFLRTKKFLVSPLPVILMMTPSKA
jgi:hypothetical protein